MAFTRDFVQQGPRLDSTFVSDGLLRAYLQWRLPSEVMAQVEGDLIRFGERCVSDVLSYAQEAEARPPRHVPFDAWGSRIDEIEVARGWQELHRVSAEEGLVALGYERAFGPYSRLVQMAKLYLFHPSSAFYSCPLAMADGAARVIELLGDDDLKAQALTHLTTRDPQKFWTSGQWMTERTGGSDVSLTTTVARWENGAYRLYGDKWFTSATTSPMALALARVEGGSAGAGGAEGRMAQMPHGKTRSLETGGSQKQANTLSLFYLELRDSNGRLQNIRIERLKDKLGTHALPTAELTLNGTPARLIGEIGDGVRNVSTLLNITRIYNSICSLGSMARCLALAKDYARKRLTFGRPLSEQPLQLETLAQLQTEFEGVFQLSFYLTELLGRDETGQATAEERALLRLLTPVAKLWSAKSAIAIASETVEAFGGAGYIENTGIPQLLRDAQVFSIWEGTTNILSLDVLRALKKEEAFEVFFREIESRLARLSQGTSSARTPGYGVLDFTREIERVHKSLEALKDHVTRLSAAGNGEEAWQASARAFAFGMGRVFAAVLLLEFAHATPQRGYRAMSLDIAKRFCQESLVCEEHLRSRLDRTRLSQLVFGEGD